MKKAIADLLSSKKFITALVGVAVVVGAKYGLALDPEVLLAIAGLFGVLLHAQGKTDAGKEAATITADAALAAKEPPPLSKSDGAA